MAQLAQFSPDYDCLTAILQPAQGQAVVLINDTNPLHVAMLTRDLDFFNHSVVRLYRLALGPPIHCLSLCVCCTVAAQLLLQP